MQTSIFNYAENKVNQAKKQLSQHRNLGPKSSLSIQQVAQLMDTIRFVNTSNKAQSIFFSFN